MIIKKYPAPPIETAAERYDRDWLNTPELDTGGFDDRRHDRTLLQQDLGRKSRRYVDDNVSAVTGKSPVFDPTIPGDNGGGTPEPGLTPLWSEDFSRSAIPSRWEVHSNTEEATQATTQLDLTDFEVVAKIAATKDGMFMIGAGGAIYVGANQYQIVTGVADPEPVLPGLGLNEVREVSIRSVDNIGTFKINGEVIYEGPLDPNISPGITITIMPSDEDLLKSITVYDLSTNGGGTPLPEGTVWSDSFSEETLGELWSQLIGAPIETNPLRSSDREQAMIASKPTLANRIETEAFFGQDEARRALGISINSAQGAPIAAITVDSSGTIVVESNSGHDSLSIGDLADKKARISVEFDQDAIRVFVDSALALTHADDSIPDGPYMLALSIEGRIEVLYFRAILNNGGGTPEPEPEIPSEPEVPEGSYQEIFTEEY